MAGFGVTTEAQTEDRRAGDLHDDGAQGGPSVLFAQPFFISINSSVHFLLPAFEQPGGQVKPGDGWPTVVAKSTFHSQLGQCVIIDWIRANRR